MTDSPGVVRLPEPTLGQRLYPHRLVFLSMSLVTLSSGISGLGRVLNPRPSRGTADWVLGSISVALGVFGLIFLATLIWSMTRPVPGVRHDGSFQVGSRRVSFDRITSARLGKVDRSGLPTLWLHLRGPGVPASMVMLVFQGEPLLDDAQTESLARALEQCAVRRGSGRGDPADRLRRAFYPGRVTAAESASVVRDPSLYPSFVA